MVASNFKHVKSKLFFVSTKQSVFIDLARIRATRLLHNHLQIRIFNLPQGIELMTTFNVTSATFKCYLLKWIVIIISTTQCRDSSLSKFFETITQNSAYTNIDIMNLKQKQLKLHLVRQIGSNFRTIRGFTAFQDYNY